MLPGGRCTVCVIQRKGKCGTDSAPKKCLKRLADGSAPKDVQGVQDPQDPPDTEDESSHHPATASGAGPPASGGHANGGGDAWAAALESYSIANPHVKIIDSVEKIRHLHNRSTMLLAFRQGRQQDRHSFVKAQAQGVVHQRGHAPQQGTPFADVLAAAGLSHVEGTGKAKGTFGDKHPKVSSHSYGAHFVEVTWQPEIAQLRVSRVLTVIDAGKIINPMTGRNQIEGAVVMGLGMALFEATEYDSRNGMPINSNLADYIMLTHADSPEMDVVFLDYPDTSLNEMGARGIGEIGIAGLAAAVTAAVHHATGVRVRALPVRVEDLL
ncbi:MAG: hypothetical protein WDW36_000643 [Sanguina aurantia]